MNVFTKMKMTPHAYNSLKDTDKWNEFTYDPTFE